MICLAFLCCLFVLCLQAAFAFVVVVVVFPAGVFPFLRPLRDGARKIFRSSPASEFLLRITASVRNGGRRTALHGVQFRCFLKRARSPAAAQRRTSVMGRWILSPSAEK